MFDHRYHGKTDRYTPRTDSRTRGYAYVPDTTHVPGSVLYTSNANRRTVVGLSVTRRHEFSFCVVPRVGSWEGQRTIPNASRLWVVPLSGFKQGSSQDSVILIETGLVQVELYADMHACARNTAYVTLVTCI
jgi:hypothetical protein